jgi:hypothetical protein
LNDILFDDPETSATLTLLKNCFSGSNFSLTPLNAPSDRKLFAGTTYIFRLELETMLSSIDPALVKKPMKDDDDDDDGSIPIWFRLLFCNALQVGFCHPLLDTREFVDDLDASHTDVVPDDTPENRNDYQQGEVLKAIGKDGIYIASRWVSWRLLPRDLEGDLYSAIVDISIILPQDAGGVYLLLGTYSTRQDEEEYPIIMVPVLYSRLRVHYSSTIIVITARRPSLGTYNVSLCCCCCCLYCTYRTRCRIPKDRGRTWTHNSVSD